MDEQSILLDGVCREVYPYLATPPAQRASLADARIDLFAFTHDHRDHFDPDFAYPLATPIVGTADVAAALPGNAVCSQSIHAGRVEITPVETRHMGKASAGEHVSFVVKGSRCVWFMGDASPVELLKLRPFPKPDVLVVPFPYVSSPGAVRKVIEWNPEQVVVVHLPLKEQDPDGLWRAVSEYAKLLTMPVWTPEIGQTILL